MTPKFSKLTDIEPRQQITQKEESAFFLHLQRALLLTLREEKRLTEMQYCHALALLQNEQRRQAAK